MNQPLLSLCFHLVPVNHSGFGRRYSVLPLYCGSLCLCHQYPSFKKLPSLNCIFLGLSEIACMHPQITLFIIIIIIIFQQAAFLSSFSCLFFSGSGEQRSPRSERRCACRRVTQPQPGTRVPKLSQQNQHLHLLLRAGRTGASVTFPRDKARLRADGLRECGALAVPEGLRMPTRGTATAPAVRSGSRSWWLPQQMGSTRDIFLV